MGFTFKAAALKPEMRARYLLDTISADPLKPIALILRHAGESNAAYMGAVLKNANAARARSGAGQLTMAQLVASRQEDVELFAAHVIVGWENVLEDDKPAPCDVDTVKRFLLALVDPAEGRPDVFDRLRTFARDPENFRAPIVQADTLGKG